METGMDKAGFNLLDEPWVRVRTLEGSVKELGLLEVFRRAPEIAGLSGESATQDMAVFRLLEAILLAAGRRLPITRQTRPAETWEALQEDQAYAVRVEEYLEEHRERFDLFHPTAPFFQVADLQKSKGEYPDASALIPDVGPGLFSTRTSVDSRSLSPAEAARWLVHRQAYDVSGIKSGTVGDPRVTGGKGYPIGTGWAGAIGVVQVVGPTLEDTLFLNLPAEELLEHRGSGAEDLAPWERSPDAAAPRDLEESVPRGVVDVLTWQQRRVRLWRDQDGRVCQVLIANGDKIRRANSFADPMTGYRYSKAQSKNGIAVYFPRTHDPDLTVWRGVQSMFAETAGEVKAGRRPRNLTQQVDVLDEAISERFEGHQLSLRLVGVEYGTQDAVVLQEIDESIPVSTQLLSGSGQELRSEAVRAVELVMSFRGSFRWFVQQLALCSGASADEASTDAVAVWMADLEIAFRLWLAGLGEDFDPAAADMAWRQILRQVSLQHIADAVEAAGPAAAVGRMEESESGRGILHSSARYESWARQKLAKTLALPETTTTSDAPPPAGAISTEGSR